jgi:hypothetical protein
MPMTLLIVYSPPALRRCSSHSPRKRAPQRPVWCVHVLIVHSHFPPARARTSSRSFWVGRPDTLPPLIHWRRSLSPCSYRSERRFVCALCRAATRSRPRSQGGAVAHSQVCRRLKWSGQPPLRPTPIANEPMRLNEEDLLAASHPALSAVGWFEPGIEPSVSMTLFAIPSPGRLLTVPPGEKVNHRESGRESCQQVASSPPKLTKEPQRRRRWGRWARRPAILVWHCGVTPRHHDGCQ